MKASGTFLVDYDACAPLPLRDSKWFLQFYKLCDRRVPLEDDDLAISKQFVVPLSEGEVQLWPPARGGPGGGGRGRGGRRGGAARGAGRGRFAGGRRGGARGRGGRGDAVDFDCGAGGGDAGGDSDECMDSDFSSGRSDVEEDIAEGDIIPEEAQHIAF